MTEVQEFMAILRDRIERESARDGQLRAALRRIESGKATFRDTALWSERASTVLGEVYGRAIPDIPQDVRRRLTESLLREQYETANAILERVQRELDAKQGLSLRPQRAEFPAERVRQLGESLTDRTVPEETVQRRARAGTANVSKSFHDSYMKENAKFRSNAGLKCWIMRDGGAKCCEWCAEIAGKYAYGDEPQDVYRRHDNCSCTVTFENGRQRQDVWSKRKWEAPKPDAGAPEPVRLTAEQAAEREAEHPVMRFTLRQAERLQERLTKADIFATIEAGSIPAIFKDYVPPREERIAIIRRGIEAPTAVFDSGSLAAYYQYVEKMPDYYDVVMHGSPYALQFFDTIIDYQTLGAIIMGRKDYRRGTKIRLVSCETGKGAECVAKYLSEMLGVEVLAPTEKITVTMPIGNKSKLIVQSAPHKHDGDWKSFGGDDES